METMTDTQAERYNGWTNYQTWAVNLWLSNDEGTYREVAEMVQGFREQAEPDEDWNGELGIGGRLLVGVVADELREYVENLPEYVEATDRASFVSDLLGHAVASVDWHEVARAWIED